jgi:hypothetical protein
MLLKWQKPIYIALHRKIFTIEILSIDLNQSYSVEHVQAVHRKAIANRLTPLNAPSVLAPTTLLWR